MVALQVLSAPVLAEVAGKMISAQGTVEVQPAGQPQRVAAASNQMLNAGDIIRTGRQSRAVVLLVDETQLKLNANTQLQLNAVRQSSNLLVRLAQSGARADQSILNLATGEAWIRSKRSPAQLSVRTPAVTAAIRGTEFNILVAPDGESIATVLEGSLDYRNDFGFVIVNPGEQGRARIGQAPTKTVILNPRDAVQWTLFYSGAVSPRDYPFVYASAAQAQTALRTASAGNAVALARIQHDAGDSAAALRTLEGNASPEAAETRGWIFLEQNRVREAILELGRAPASSARTRLGLSLAHYRLNELAEAYRYVENPGADSILKLQKATLDLISGDVQTSRALLETIPQNDPVFTLAQGLLSNVNLTQNDKDKALAAAQRAVSANPDSPSAYLNLSLVQQSFFDLPAATRSVEKSLSLDPNFLQAQIQYAKLLFGAGNSAKAESVIRRALAQAPEEAAVHSTLGFVQLGRAQTREARASFETSLKLDSTRGEPHLGIGIANMREGEETDAVTEMLEAATLEPQIALYQSYLGKAFYEERKFEQAFSALRAAMELDPRDPTPHLYSGIFQNDLNRPGEAVASYQASIRLNDNRAVYRSRFILDEDRATRNVNLAAAYNRLGLAELANAEAIRSTLMDPSNSSAHLFLAGTFLNLKGRTLAAGGELLLTRLLLPVNVNSFNAFNDYTTLFEFPRTNWSVQGSLGSFDSSSGTLISSGGTRRFAYSSVVTRDESDGFRLRNDDSRSYTTVNFLKFAITPHTDILFSYSHQQTREGDHGLTPNLKAAPLVTANNDRNRRFFGRTNRAEIGFHKEWRPGSDLILYFSGLSNEQVFDDPDAERVRGVLFSHRTSSKAPTFNFQTEHLLKLSGLQLKYGLDILEGRSRNRRVEHDTRFQLPEGLNYCFLNREDSRVACSPNNLDPMLRHKKIRYKTVFLQTDYVFSPKLVLTGGLSYDWSSDNNLFDDIDERVCDTGELWNRSTGFCEPITPLTRPPSDPLSAFSTRYDRPVSTWNPHGGVLFSPSATSTFRFAAMKVMQTHGQAKISPSHINGFVFNQSEPELTRSKNYNIAWDQRYERDSFIRTTAVLSLRKIPRIDYCCALGGRPDVDVPVDLKGRLYGGTISLNQFLSERLTFVPEYRLERSEEVNRLRIDHEARFGLFYVSPQGLFFELRQSYLNQHGFYRDYRLGVPFRQQRQVRVPTCPSGQNCDLSVFTTDISASYELPRKAGLISLRVSNLFDRRYEYLADPLALDPRVPRRQVALFLRFNF